MTAASRNIDVYEVRLKKDGYFVWDNGEESIFLNLMLRDLRWLEAAYHELSHGLLDVPTAEFLRRKQELHAYAFALIAIIPQRKVFDYSFLEDYPNKYAWNLFKDRQRLYFLYGV